MQEIIRERLDELGLTVDEAAKMCGLTVETMAVLAQGYTTLPSLAVKAGHGLGLKKEQVGQVGQALDKSSWQRNVEPSLTAPAIDFDTRWADKYRYRPMKQESVAEAHGIYLNVHRLAEYALEHEKSVRELLRAADIQSCGYLCYGTERAKLGYLEEMLGLEEGTLRQKARPRTYRVEVWAEVRKRELIDAMQERNVTEATLAQRLGCTTQNVRKKLFGHNNECPVDVTYARRVAEALGMELKELFTLRIVNSGR